MGLNQKKLEDFFISIDEKPFRAAQVLKWIHQRGISDFSQMTDLSKDLRTKLENSCVVEGSRSYLRKNIKGRHQKVGCKRRR